MKGWSSLHTPWLRGCSCSHKGGIVLFGCTDQLVSTVKPFVSLRGLGCPQNELCTSEHVICDKIKPAWVHVLCHADVSKLKGCGFNHMTMYIDNSTCGQLQVSHSRRQVCTYHELFFDNVAVFVTVVMTTLGDNKCFLKQEDPSFLV